MPLEEGSSLGPYCLGPRLGAGGMGEVYRAHDDRLDRDVAIKVLPADVADDPERLARFDTEARAAASLNHPNIVGVHDIGQADGVTYVVMELLDGATLKEEMESRPPTTRKAVEWTVGVAEGLAAAHARGVVHRDIKPDLVVTAEGRIKILDFGIARLTTPQEGAPEAATVAEGTEPGKILGTAGYMSPEQVRGEAIDHRSDIFSLGAVLYEMLAGKRAFEGDSAVETLHAVLKTDPPELTTTGSAIPLALDRIVRRCLEKRPADRFHSAHDLALALDAVRGSQTQPTLAIPSARRPPGRLAVAGAALLLVLATAAVTRWWSAAQAPASGALPSIRQVAVRRGTIDTARFTSGGDAVVYSARLGGVPSAPYETRLGTPGARRVGPDDATLLGEAEGTLLLGLEPELHTGRLAGRLATLQPGPGVPRAIAEKIIAADIVDGGIAAIENPGNGSLLHLPVGTVVEESSLLGIAVRASPDRSAVAYLLERGRVIVYRADGSRAGELTDIPPSTSGLAWAPSGDRLWMSAVSGRGETTILSVALGESPREEWRLPGIVSLQDVASDGRLLVRRDEAHGGTLVLTPESPEAVDLAWLDQATAMAFTPARDALLLRDTGGSYLRALDGSPALRLGGDGGLAISPDGQLVIRDRGPRRFELLPVGVGTAREIELSDIESFFAWFHPDGRRILYNGREAGGTWRFFIADLDDPGAVEPFGPDNFEHWIGQVPLSDDGRWLAGFPLPARTRHVFSVDDDALLDIRGMAQGEVIIRFADDPGELYVYDREALPARIFRLDYRTGERRLWREFMPGDPAGIPGFESVAMTSDGRTMAFNYRRVLSTLYEIDGLQ